MSQPTTSILLNSTAPGAPAGNQNVKPQSDGATPLQSITLYPQKATSSLLGVVKPDGTTTTVASDGTLSAAAGPNSAMWMLLPNDTAGTAINLLASWVGSFLQDTIKTTPITNNNGTDAAPCLVGVVIAGAGTTGNATVQFAGACPLLCDMTVSPGDWIQPSVAVAGQGHSPLGGHTETNENPEANSIIGRVLVGNTGANTIAIVQLMPLGMYTPSLPGNSPSPGGFLMPMGPGSPFLSQTYWGQEPVTHALISGKAIKLFSTTGSNYFSIDPTPGNGTSGKDLLVDLLSNGPGLPTVAMLRLNASSYNVPTIQNVSGTVSFGQTGFFRMGNTGGVFILTLTGNATTFNPVNDNPGHIVTFEIIQAASGGPYTWTWPSSFKNAPAVTTVAGASTVASFLYDGTNYWYLGGGGGSFTNPMTTAGDLIAGGSAGAPTRLGIGSAGQVLTVVGGAPAWASAGGGASTFSLVEVALTPSSDGNFTVAHGLGVAPASALIQMTSGGQIWFQSARFDATNLYLVASEAGVTGKAVVLYSATSSLAVTEVALAPSVPGNFTVAHGLGVTPASAAIQMDSGGQIWFQSPTRFDATNLYLVASDGSITGRAVLFH